MNRRAISLACALTTVIGAASCAGAAYAQTVASPYTAGYRYDDAGRQTGVILPDPDGSGTLHFAATRNTYDDAGRLTTVEKGELAAWQPEGIKPKDWDSNTTFTILQRQDIVYDAMSRKVRETLSSGGVAYSQMQYSYNGQNKLECEAVRMNPAVYASPPASACSLGAQGSSGADRITRTTYVAELPWSIQKAYGTPLQQVYVSYRYTGDRKLAAVIDANGNKAAMTYDGFDRQARWYFPDTTTVGQVSTTDFEEYGYDANGNRTSLTRRDGRTLTFSYDALDRVTSKIVPEGCSPTQPVPAPACPPASATRDVYYSYDLQGHQLAARFDSASGVDAVLSGWNGFGEQASSTTAMSGTSRTLTYLYDADGARTRVTFPDSQYVEYFRDGLDRVDYTRMSGTTLLFKATYDAAGHAASLARSVGGAWSIPTTSGYDGVGRLTSLSHDLAGTSGDVTSTFTYNPASQIVSRSRSNSAYAFTDYVNVSRAYTANGLNQYVSAGPATFSYDANGNLTGDGARTYGYDAENRLISSSAGATLTYDAIGRLWEESGTTTATSRFLYDGDALIAEYDTAGAMLKRYVHSDGEDDPLVQYAGSTLSNPSYFYADHQGSIVAMTDALGNVAQVNRYDEYGIPGGGNAGRFQYTGQAWLPSLGMYYFKARIYSPTLGRFLQTDPIGYNDQVNLYAYAQNDSVNNTDPSGECTGSRIEGSDGQCAGGGFSTGITGAAQRMATEAAKLQSQVAKWGGQAAASYKRAKAEFGNFPGNTIRRIMGPFQRFWMSGSWTRVGRWMSSEERTAMISTGLVQPGVKGIVNVTRPPDPDGWKADRGGREFVTFSVPSSSLRQGGSEGWANIVQPGSIYDTQAKNRNGIGLTPVPATSIYVTDEQR